MYENLKQKTECIAEKYAELIEKRITETLGNEVTEHEAMEEIQNGIKMLGYLVTAIDRMGRSYNGSNNNL